MPQIIVFLDKEENKLVEDFRDHNKLDSKHESIKQMIRRTKNE